jgi:hypothetical protein
VDQGGSGDEGVAVGVGIGNVEKGAAARDGCVDGEDAVFEGRKNAGFHPGAEYFALGAVSTFGEQDADIEFKDGDGGKIERGGGLALGPVSNVRVGFVGLAEFVDDVGVEQEHEEKG